MNYLLPDHIFGKTLSTNDVLIGQSDFIDQDPEGYKEWGRYFGRFVMINDSLAGRSNSPYTSDFTFILLLDIRLGFRRFILYTGESPT
jgi:hypothetical protein